jgi:hypothetical protein
LALCQRPLFLQNKAPRISQDGNATKLAEALRFALQACTNERRQIGAPAQALMLPSAFYVRF